MCENKKASEFLDELCANVDFSVAGYRPPLKEPLVLAVLDEKCMEKIKKLGYNLANKELKVSTQRQLFHGMRSFKQSINKAFSKDEFIKMPLNFTCENLYIGFDKYNEPFLNFFWGDEQCYAYFGFDCELKTYGKTDKNTILANKAIKISQ